LEGFFIFKNMRIFIFLFIITSSLFSIAQEDTTIYEVQDVEPEYPGEFSDMMIWIQQSIQEKEFTSDEIACITKIYVEFVVEKDGSLSNVKARNKCNSDLTHFTELFSKSPKWTPGQYKGKIVRSRYRLPITIDFQN